MMVKIGVIIMPFLNSTGHFRATADCTVCTVCTLGKVSCKLNIFSCPVSKRSERFFEWADLSPAQFEKLTKRCNKLIALSIIGTITINGISNIMKNLSQTLEKIRVGLTTHGWRSEQGNFLKGIVNKTVRR